MTNSKPKPGPVAEPDRSDDVEVIASTEGRDRSVPRMSEGTRQDILQFGRVQDPHDPTRWLTAADIPQ